MVQVPSGKYRTVRNIVKCDRKISLSWYDQRLHLTRQIYMQSSLINQSINKNTSAHSTIANESEARMMNCYTDLAVSSLATGVANAIL